MQGEFQAVMTAYLNEMSHVSFKLLEAFCLGLGLPAQTLRPVFEVSNACCLINETAAVAGLPGKRTVCLPSLAGVLQAIPLGCEGTAKAEGWPCLW